MKSFAVTANGQYMGTYQGESAEEALDAYAREAGYRDYAAALAVTGDDARAVEWCRPGYCTRQSVPHCWECSLTSYGRDCQNEPVGR